MLMKKLKKPDPKAEQRLRNEIEEYGGLEKTDLPAMIISAMLTFIPVAALVLGMFCLIAWLFLS